MHESQDNPPSAAEDQLREGAMLKALVNTAVDGILVIDAKGIIRMANPACEKLFGYGTEEMLGQNVKMLMSPPYRDEHDDHHKTREPKIIGIGREVMGQRKDGSTFPMNLSVGEAQQDGVSSFVGIIHDLTERKRTEEQLVQAQKMETVGQLSGGIAHDFNNLLTVIIGNADLLAEGVGNRSELRQLCETVLAAGARGAELTRRLLAFSRRQTLQPSIIDCGKLVENMQLMLRRTLREDIDIRIAVDSNLDRAFADPTQMESAILNLALNARDAMPLGGHLVITVGNASLSEDDPIDHPDVKSGNYVMISVTDDGEGMAPETRARAFEPFFTTKEVGKGSGLGLSMIYGFVKQSNGHVTIYSEPGLGTTVRLYLPAAEVRQPAVPQPHNVVDLDALRGHETVLVAEDDPFVRNHAVKSLEDFGYNVIIATDGQAALAILCRGTPVDVLFSDIVMPGGISGWDLAEQALKYRPNLKVLLTSGYPMETITARHQHRHNNDFPLLNKPYRKIELGQRLRKILDASPLDQDGAVTPPPLPAIAEASSMRS